MNNNVKLRRLVFFILLGAQFCISNVHAAENLLDASKISDKPILLVPYISFLEDSGLALTLADVQKPSIAANFRTDAKATDALGFGYTHSAWWLRLSISNTGNQPVIACLKSTMRA